MRLLVTGGAGFIGSNFLHMLAEGKIELAVESITVLDSLTYAGDLSNIKSLINSGTVNFFEGDITDEKIVSQLLDNNDAIINFAAESHVDRSIQNSHNFIETNILGTHVLLKAASERNIKRFMQVSTDEVYGSISQGSWDEECPLQPNSMYSASKASADLLTLAMHRTHGLDVVISRSSNNYGPRQNPEKLIPKLVINSLRDLPLPIYGTGKNVREWIHVDDHCRAIATIFENGLSGKVYNVGSGEEFSNIEVATKIIESCPDTKSEIEFIDDRPGHDFRYSVDFKKIELLGFVINRSFDEAIIETVEWYKNNESWWKNLLEKNSNLEMEKKN